MNKFVFTLVSAGLLGIGLTAQATTDAELQALLQQAMSGLGAQGTNLSTTNNNATGTVVNTAQNTTTKKTVTVERLNYSPSVADTYVKVNGIISINIKTVADPTTPIEIFLLAFDANSNPVKKIFIKNVYNEKRNVVKQYKLMINQDILDQSKQAAWLQVGYCVGGCKSTKSKMIKGRIILPRTQQPSSSN